MKIRSSWSEVQNFFMKEYGMTAMSLTAGYGLGELVEIEMHQSGLIKLMSDLAILKASKDLVSDGIPEEPPREEIKCTFDEVMRFEQDDERPLE